MLPAKPQYTPRIFNTPYLLIQSNSAHPKTPTFSSQTTSATTPANAAPTIPGITAAAPAFTVCTAGPALVLHVCFPLVTPQLIAVVLSTRQLVLPALVSHVLWGTVLVPVILTCTQEPLL